MHSSIATSQLCRSLLPAVGLRLMGAGGCQPAATLHPWHRCFPSQQDVLHYVGTVPPWGSLSGACPHRTKLCSAAQQLWALVFSCIKGCVASAAAMPTHWQCLSVDVDPTCKGRPWRGPSSWPERPREPAASRFTVHGAAMGAAPSWSPARLLCPANGVVANNTTLQASWRTVCNLVREFSGESRDARTFYFDKTKKSPQYLVRAVAEVSRATTEQPERSHHH